MAAARKSPRNRYRPGDGMKPFPNPVGRQGHRQRFHARLEHFADTPRNTCLLGVDGNGKTVLTREFIDDAKECKWVVGSRALTRGLNSEQQLAVAFSTLAEEKMDELSAVGSLRRVRPTAGVSIQFAEGVQLTFQLAAQTGDLTLSDAITGSLRTIGEKVQKSRDDGLVVVLDNAHELYDRPEDDQHPLSALLNAFLTVQAENLPLMLVLSGRPQLGPQIAAARGTAPASFDSDLVGPLSLQPGDAGISEGAQVLLAPVEQEEVGYDRDTAERVAGDAGGSPLLLQRLGWSLFDFAVAAGTAVIDDAFYEQHRDRALLELDRNHFEHLFAAADADGRRVLSAAAALRQDEFSVDQLGGVPGEVDVEATLNELVDGGLLFRAAADRFGFPLAGFGDFLRRRDQR